MTNFKSFYRDFKKPSHPKIASKPLSFISFRPIDEIISSFSFIITKKGKYLTLKKLVNLLY